ncbi:MAG: [Fe-Fe] hydrogenase large subunit C-terminal domain-containing protein [Planctomycetota bacterium]
MNSLQPIYTEVTRCQDCYKCLRQCPVKAIDIRNGHASVISDLCILCGNCVQTCPMGAKRVRSDIERAKLLFRMKRRVFVSLAPSFLTEFSDVNPGQLIAAMKALGFEGVSETALGAEQVSAAVADKMNTEKTLAISSACPAVVELVKRYWPQYSDDVCNMLSPLLAHCKLLRAEYGRDIGIVFVGPCIAKKTEADQNEFLLDVVLTFEELRQWLGEEAVDIGLMKATDEDDFVPRRAADGVLYPIDGGMIAGVKADSTVTDGQFMAFSGIDAIQDSLEELDTLKDRGPLFLELLACDGGCVNGPHVRRQGATILKRHAVIDSFQQQPKAEPVAECIEVSHQWPIKPVQQAAYEDDQLWEALKRVGKFGPEDELNCGGCGYDSCRQFAQALLDGRAEHTMCVGYMRQLAQKQADALLRAMPSGVVIVDNNLEILESNRRFSEIMGADVVRAYEACPHLTGAKLEKIVPFYGLFEQVLQNGTANLEKDIKVGEAIFHVTVFTIEKHRLIGGIVQDITEPSVRKEQIVEKAKKVIAHNLETVQQIAFLLGENAAESEVILNSIVDMFKPATIDGQEPCDG